MIQIVIALLANTVAHVISYLKLRSIKAPNATGVLVFAIINAAIALLLWQGIDWAKWLALAFPIIGGLGLLTVTILKGKGTWIDYIILVLDIVIITLVLNYYFF